MADPRLDIFGGESALAPAKKPKVGHTADPRLDIFGGEPALAVKPGIKAAPNKPPLGQKMIAPDVNWNMADQLGAGAMPAETYKAMKKAWIEHNNPGMDPKAISDSVEQAAAKFAEQNPRMAPVLSGAGTAATLALPIGAGAKVAGEAIPAAARLAGPAAGKAAEWALGQAGKQGANVASRVGSRLAGGLATAEGANVAANAYTDPHGDLTKGWNHPITLAAGALPGATQAAGEATRALIPESIPAVKGIMQAAAKKVGFNVGGENPGVALPAGSASAKTYQAAQSRGYGPQADDVDQAFHTSLKKVLGPAAEAHPDPRVTGDTIAAVKAAEGAKLQDIAGRTTINLERAPKMGQGMHEADQMLNPVDPATGTPGISLITNPQELALARQHMAKIDSMTQQRMVPDGQGGTRPQWQLDGKEAFELSKTGSQLEKWARQDGPMGDWARATRKALREGIKESIQDPAEATRFQEASERYKIAHDLEDPVSRGRVGSLTPQQADAAIERNYEGAGPDVSDSPASNLPLNQARILTKAALQARPRGGPPTANEGNVGGAVGSAASMLVSGEPLSGAVLGNVAGRIAQGGKSGIYGRALDSNANAARLMEGAAPLTPMGKSIAQAPLADRMMPSTGDLSIRDALTFHKPINPLLGASQPTPAPWAPPPLVGDKEDQ